MSGLMQQAAAVLAGNVLTPVVALIVLTVPGLTLVSLGRCASWLPAPLLPAACVTSSLLMISPLLALRLTVHLPIALTILGMLALTVGLWLLARRTLPTDSTRLQRATLGVISNGPEWSDPWIRTGMGATLIALVTAVISGGAVRSDAMFHTMQALKLQRLPHPGWNNTLQFIDGSAHPGYLLPSWQEMVALIATAGWVQPIDVMWMLPVVLTPIAVLAWGGMGMLVIRSRAGFALGAVSFVLLQIITTTSSLFAIRQAAYPRQVITDIVFPVLICAWLASGDRATTGSHRRSARIALAAAVAVVVVLHNSYIVFLAIMLAGSAIAQLLAGGRGELRETLARLSVNSLIAGGVSGAGIAIMLPTIRQLNIVQVQGAGVSLEQQQANAPIGMRLGEYFIGTSQAFHMRADLLVWYGGLSLLALCCIPITVLLGRTAIAQFVLGSTLAAQVAVLLAPICMPLVDAIGANQVRRISLAVPVVPAMTITLVLLAMGLDRLWTRGRSGRWLGYASALACSGVIAALTYRYWLQLIPDRSFLPLWPIYATAGVLLVLAVAGVASLATSRVRLPQLLPQPSARALATALVIVLVGCAPAWVRWGVDVHRLVTVRTAVATRYVSLKRLRMLDESLAKIPTGDIVLADAKTANRLVALYPVYVTAEIPGHVADTARNRPYERVEQTDGFLARPSSERLRLQRLLQLDARWLVLNHRRSKVRHFARRHQKVFTRLQYNRFYSVWRVNRARARRELAGMRACDKLGTGRDQCYDDVRS